MITALRGTPNSNEKATKARTARAAFLKLERTNAATDFLVSAMPAWERQAVKKACAVLSGLESYTHLVVPLLRFCNGTVRVNCDGNLVFLTCVKRAALHARIVFVHCYGQFCFLPVRNAHGVGCPALAEILSQLHLTGCKHASTHNQDRTFGN